MFDQTPNRKLITNKLSGSYQQQVSAERIKSVRPNDELLSSYWNNKQDDQINHTQSAAAFVNHNQPDINTSYSAMKV